MKKTFVITATFAVSLLWAAPSFAGDLEWSGLYRAEGLLLTNTALSDSNKKDKTYGLHHFVLKPRIVAADGLFINSRFDIFNLDTVNYPNSQHGQLFGRAETGADIQGDDEVLGQAGQQESIVATHLYMTLVQEFGSLIIGRTPMHFGLGITHNAGNGLFDHWLDTRDLVGYKIVMGNVFFLPMIGKVNEGDLTGTDDVTDYMVQLQYDNDETDTEMGLFYQARQAGQSATVGKIDTATFGDEAGGGAGAAATGNFDVETINFYYKKENPGSYFGVEASYISGDTGVTITAEDKEVDWSASAVAVEFGFTSNKWDWGFKLGYATGDDADSADSYEGYLFDRNYDLGMLMFNQELGQQNFLRTGLLGTDPANSRNRVDIETISNAFYFAPTARYQWKDKYAIDFTVIGGWLNETVPSPGAVKTKSELGYELDIALDYKPNQRMSWRNEIGVLFQGSAFEQDSAGNKIDTDIAYGFVSKAAISF